MKSCSTAQGTRSHHLWYNVIKDNARKRMYTYVQLGHFAVQQKLTEHCKSAIIKIFFKK